MYSHHHPGTHLEAAYSQPQHHAGPPQMPSAGHPPLVETTRHQEGTQPRTHGTDLIGRPIRFASGQFAGQTMRAELREVQKADLGRKYARVDRRPLDPPPVVQLRLYHVFNEGTNQETEKEVNNYDEVQVLGLVCTVDLFPVPGPGHPDPETSKLSSSPSQTTFSASPSNHYSSDPKQYPFITSTVYAITESGLSAVADVPTVHLSSQKATGYGTSPQSESDVVHRIEDFSILESSKLTGNLVGATFIQPSCVEYQGKKALIFVFADLAVKIEGTFILRYRVFDIFSRPDNYQDDLAIQAECYGGSFRVYSTKEFPGLQASTELTKHLARWGVRLNIRETERRRRKKGEVESPSPPVPAYPKNNKRKRTSPASPQYPTDEE